MKKYLFSSLLSLAAALCLLGAGTPAARAQTTERFTTQINGATISYAVTGSGATTLFLIHGYPLNGDLFAKQRQAFGATYRVITPDLRGFGASTAPDENASIEIYANDMRALLDQLGIQQAIIGGHSMGGAIALQMYSQAPNRFLGLILNDAAAMPPPTVERFMWQGYQRQVHQMEGNTLILPLLLPEFLTGATRTAKPALAVKVANLVRAASTNGLVGGASALENRPDFSAVFPTISVPTLILYGQEDSLTPMEQARMLQSLIPHSTLVIVPGATHGVIREAPGAANAAIQTWLNTSFP